MAKNAATLPERLRLLLANDPAKDKAAAFLWPFLSSLWNFAADRIGEVADDAPSIDAAMRAGFNWELGPFEMWDAAGVAETVARMKALQSAGRRSRPRPPRRYALQLVLAGSQRVLSAGHRPDRSQFPPFPATPASPISAAPHAVVRTNPGASLVDLGDGIACIELHSLKNAIGGDVLSLISAVLNPASDAVRDFAGFVISGDRENFSVGANLMQLLLAAQEGEWDELAHVIHNFQQMTAAIKFCPRPVVAAPFGLTLGGGAEICLHAARRQPHAETYMGLVEAGVGLIPAGGGTKEMLLRAFDAAAALAPPDPRDPPSRFAQSAEFATALKRALETIAMAKVSTSAAEARSLGLLSPADRITMNRERLLLDAKAQAAVLAESGYTPPQPRTQIPAPGIAALATARNRHLSDGRSRLRLRARPESCPLGRVHPRRRPRHARHSRQRAIFPRSRTRGLPLPLRRAQNAGAHRLHPQNRQAAAQLIPRCLPPRLRFCCARHRVLVRVFHGSRAIPNRGSRSSRCFFCCLPRIHPQDSGASPLNTSGQVIVDGHSTPYLIRHLPVNSFPQLPPAVQDALTRRGCLIPQTYEAHQPENVVHASLERPGSSDWAVLCSANGTVSLLVFFPSE